ncbi:Fanconi anemia group F protein [Hypanus sabinus]|uniref:Fanconi anemia group F protein n=1 Tax=Hypanus sabinus TaxID=79690 RepID=UPI0028C47C0D|nr:Fanconi anemia group F protein [Hypanus sabinus]
MESVLENLERFAEVLAVARSPWASHWDEAAVTRAFQWACYFQQLDLRLEGNTSAQAALRRQLNLPGRCTDHPLPWYRGLRFEELSRGQEMLSQALLCNPAASAAAFHRAASWYRSASSSRAAVTTSLRRAARLTAAARVLQACRRSAAGPGEGSTERQPVAETQAEILRQRLGEQRRELPEQEVLRRTVSGGGGDGADSWRPLAALLSAAGAEEAPPRTWRWLLGNRDALSAACRALPCSVLARLAAREPAFSREYLDFLRQWARRMRYDASSGRWTHEESPELDWERLLQHFSSLLQGPPQTKEWTRETLNSLKTKDGDFEVWGISIWTDLLLALRQQKIA